MAQRYTNPLAHQRMEKGLCPECGRHTLSHSDDLRFWVRDSLCDLTSAGVADRIGQYLSDLGAKDGGV